MVFFYRRATEPASLPEVVQSQRMLQVDANRLVLAWSGSNDIWIYDRASSRKKTRFWYFITNLVNRLVLNQNGQL